MALYLGECSSLVSMMDDRFPELNMTSADCRPMTWLETAALSFTDMSSTGTVEDALLSRGPSMSVFTKGKSDYVRTAISRKAWKGIFSWFAMNGSGIIMLEPHGGFMDTVPAAATPYPHRSGVLYVIQYIVFWQGDGGPVATAWLAKFYDFMGRHVSKNPRQAYVNFRDLDIGQNAAAGDGNNASTFETAKAWGERYFMGNYQRLAAVKAAADPTDYFRHEQSVPPLLQRSN
jgi:hypothetical protein